MLEARGERNIDLPGLRLAAACWGPEDGVPVLALHGWLDNAASFERLAAHLSGIQLVALDLAGHGGSQHRADGAYLFIDYVAEVAAAIEALGWERCALLGHSLGAGVGALVAGTWPERITRLVMLEGWGPLTHPDAGAPVLLRQAIAAELAAARRPERPVYPDREAVARRLAQATGMQPESAEILLRRGLQAVPGGWTWRADSRLRLTSRTRMTEAQVEAFLRAIACPALLVRARPGMPIDESLAAARIAAVAGLQVAALPGGHHVHLDDPAAVAAVVGPFLLGA